MVDTKIDRLFPIQKQRDAKPHPMLIPWSVAELAYSVYAGRYGTGQSLERLAERGGFGPGEMDMFLPDWRERCDELTKLRALVATIRLPEGLTCDNGNVRALVESLQAAAKGKSDLDYQAEISRAMAFIPSEFFGNDAWENAIGRMAAALVNLRGKT